MFEEVNKNTHHNQLSAVFKCFHDGEGAVFEEGQLLAYGHQIVIDALALFASPAQSVVQNALLTVQQDGEALTTNLSKKQKSKPVKPYKCFQSQGHVKKKKRAYHCICSKFNAYKLLAEFLW